MRIINGTNCDFKILEIVKFFKHSISLPNINEAYEAPGTSNHYVCNKENYKQFDSLASRVFDAAWEQGMEWLFWLCSPQNVFIPQAAIMKIGTTRKKIVS